MKLPFGLKVPPLRITAVLAKVAGGAGTAIFALGGPRWVAIGGAVAAFAGLILDLLPAAQVMKDAPIVNQSGVKVATNVSTIPTLPIQSSQGG